MTDIVNVDVTSLSNLKSVENDINKKRSAISHTDTPPNQIKKRPDGLDYVEEGFMRHQLNKYYPIWSWSCDEMQFLGSEWVWVRGTLTIVEEGIPRSFGSVGATRIQFKKGTPHTPENIIDIDKNVASANTDAFKRAVNRLTNISDDVYRKQVNDPLSDSQRMQLLECFPDESRKRAIKVKIERGDIHGGNVDDIINELKNQKEK